MELPFTLYFIMIQVISLATKYNPQYNWWIGLHEAGSGRRRVEGNEYFSWSYEWPQNKLAKDFPLWSAGSPAFTAVYPVVGLILPSGLVGEVTKTGSKVATDKMVFPICKLGITMLNTYLVLPSSASTQFQFQFRPRTALFLACAATHPFVTVVSETNSRLFQDYFIQGYFK